NRGSELRRGVKGQRLRSHVICVRGTPPPLGGPNGFLSAAWRFSSRGDIWRRTSRLVSGSRVRPLGLPFSFLPFGGRITTAASQRSSWLRCAPDAGTSRRGGR